MKGTAKTITMCGKVLNLGDRVVVRYSAGHGRLTGFITELWSIENDNHLQASVGETPSDKGGWCFHDHDHIVEHESEPERTE